MRLRQFVERRPELKNFLKALARPFRQESSSGYAEFDPLTRADRVAALNLPGMTGELARQAQALGCANVEGREVWTLLALKLSTRCE